MSKPINPPTDEYGDNYMIEAIGNGETSLPPGVATSLRHLMMACELGDLVVVEFTTFDDGMPVYILCAHILDIKHKARLLPICHLPEHGSIIESLRPPAPFAKSDFVRPRIRERLAFDVIEYVDGSVVIAEQPNSDDRKH